MRRFLGVAALLPLIGCGEVFTGYGTRYTGALSGCGLPAATLSLKAGQFSFTPGDGALMIAGTVAPDGSFAGTLNTQPAGKPPFELHVSGRIAADQASVDYVTPRCRAAGNLDRVRPPLL
jgi:hypothetical protein